jgi:2-polyprenyl-3-methyl-5-hydroxy-6-metoxy-1,4-benzoquinol methylase
MPITMQELDSSRYHNSSKNWWKYDPKWVVLNEITKPETVLDVGCSYGDFGIQLKSKGCAVDGVEIYEPAFKEATKVLDSVFKLDMDSPETIRNGISKCYSLITFMDVLEHCKDPETVLRLYKSKLIDGGRVYISLPNVVNIRERLLFLLGNFDYQEYGVLDKTHLRFYTKKSALALMKLVFSEVRLIESTPRYNFLKKVVRFWPEMFALQFVIEGKC